MIQKFGVILLEKPEIIIRIYEADNKEWRLIHYQSIPMQFSLHDEELSTRATIMTLSEFLISSDAEHVTEWKTCARGFNHRLIREISLTLGLTIENLTVLREQELLCKGMFTELW
jgi:hypothetical protein